MDRDIKVQQESEVIIMRDHYTMPADDAMPVDEAMEAQVDSSTVEDTTDEESTDETT